MPPAAVNGGFSYNLTDKETGKVELLSHLPEIIQHLVLCLISWLVFCFSIFNWEWQSCTGNLESLQVQLGYAVIPQIPSYFLESNIFNISFFTYVTPFLPPLQTLSTLNL